MGNALRTCNCCDNSLRDNLVGSIWIQDHFQILKRMPSRAESKPDIYEKQEDEEEQEEESEKESERESRSERDDEEYAQQGEKNENGKNDQEKGRESSLSNWLRGLAGVRNSNEEESDALDKDAKINTTKGSTGKHADNDFAKNAGPYQQF